MNCGTNNPVGPRAIKYFIDRKMGPCMEEMGLNVSCGPFILGIFENKDVSLKDLSTAMMVDKSLTTRTVRTLIEKGFVENISTNPRSYSLILTEKGIEAALTIRAQVDKVWEHLTKDLTEEEKKCLRTAHDKINNVIKEDTERVMSKGEL